MKTTVLIAGGSGFLGRHIRDAFKKSGYAVASPSSSELDITDTNAVETTLDRISPAILVNCACITGYANCQKDPERARRVNINGAVFLANICKERGILFVQPSSATIFDGTKKEPYKENDAPQIPKNISGQTKFEAENAVLSSGADALIPRITTACGAPATGDTTNILGHIVEMLEKNGKTHPLFVDQKANVVAADEVGNAIVALIEKHIRGVIHLGGPDVLSIWEFGNLIKEIFELEGEIPKGSVQGTDYPSNMVLDTSRTQALGITFSPIKQKLAEIAGR